MIDIINPIISGILAVIPSILMVLSGYSVGTIIVWVSGNNNLSVVRKLIYGNIILCFIFISGFIIFGILQHEVRFYFTIFTYFLMALSSIGIYFLVRTIVPRLIRYSVKEIKNAIFILFGIALFTSMVIYYAAIIFHHPIFLEYDSVYLFLPIAKSIILGNGLNHDFFTGSDISIRTPPLTQAINAWLINSFGYGSIRFFPFYYVCFTSILVYAFTQSITKNKDRFTAIIASCLFLVTPALLVVSSRFSLQQDLPFILFLTSSFYFLSLIMQQEKPGGKEVSLLIISLSLMMVTREIGIALGVAILFLMPAIKFTKGNMKLKSIFTILIFFPLYLLSLYDLMYYGLTTLIILRIATLLASTCLLSYILTKVRNQNEITELKPYFKYLAFFIIPLIFVISNIITFNGPYPTLIFSKSYNDALVLYGQVFAIPNPIHLPISEAIKELPRMDILFISVTMGSIFIFIKFRGLGRVFYNIRRNSNYALLLSLLVVMLVIWSYLLRSGYEISDIRHILYFAPLLTVLVVEGLSIGNESYLRLYNYAIVVLAIYIFISFDLFVWNYDNHFGGFWIDPVKNIIMNYNDLKIAIGLAASIIIIEIERDKLSNYFSKYNLEKYIIAGFCILLFFQVYTLANSGITLTSLFAMDNIPPSNWENNVYGIVQYLKDAEPGNIFSIRAPAIPYFTDRTNFDLYNPHTFASLQSLTASNNPHDFRDQLLLKNIRYLVIPNANNSWYYLVQNLSKRSDLLKFMDHNNNFRKVTIGKFDLYKLISFSRKINLLGMEEHWKPYLNAKIFHRNNDSLLVYVNNSNRGIIYHRASLPTQIGLNERPLLLSLDYTSKSNNTQTKFLVEMRENNNSTNNAGKKILWNHLLQNTDGKLVQETFVLPSNIDNMPIEIRLYIITTERDNDSLFLKTFYISYT